MSRINFVDLSTERPDLGSVWKRFADWVEDHPNKRIIDPRALARSLRDVSTDDLFEACRVMVAHRLLKQGFMVEARNGQLVGDVYSSPLDIPESIAGGFEEWVDTADANVVAVFVEEAPIGQ